MESASHRLLGFFETALRRTLLVLVARSGADGVQARRGGGRHAYAYLRTRQERRGKTKRTTGTPDCGFLTQSRCPVAGHRRSKFGKSHRQRGSESCAAVASTKLKTF